MSTQYYWFSNFQANKLTEKYNSKMDPAHILANNVWYVKRLTEKNKLITNFNPVHSRLYNGRYTDFETDCNLES